MTPLFYGCSYSKVLLSSLRRRWLTCSCDVTVLWFFLQQGTIAISQATLANMQLKVKQRKEAAEREREKRERLRKQQEVDKQRLLQASTAAHSSSTIDDDDDRGQYLVPC